MQPENEVTGPFLGLGRGHSGRSRAGGDRYPKPGTIPRAKHLAPIGSWIHRLRSSSCFGSTIPVP